MKPGEYLYEIWNRSVFDKHLIEVSFQRYCFLHQLHTFYCRFRESCQHLCTDKSVIRLVCYSTVVNVSFSMILVYIHQKSRNFWGKIKCIDYLSIFIHCQEDMWESNYGKQWGIRFATPLIAFLLTLWFEYTVK